MSGLAKAVDRVDGREVSDLVGHGGKVAGRGIGIGHLVAGARTYGDRGCRANPNAQIEKSEIAKSRIQQCVTVIQRHFHLQVCGG